MAELGPTDDELIAEAVDEARAAGVPEAAIARVIREEARLNDELSVLLIEGKLSVLAKQARRAAVMPEGDGFGGPREQP